MNVLSLFSGIGGIDLGLERAGMRIVGQVEIDPFCRDVLSRHWPRVPRHDDVRSCLKWWQQERRPDVHVIAAGFPCQPFSIAGPKRGQTDERWLWPPTVRVVRALRPPWTLLENVPGILREDWGTVLADLAAIGYDAEWESLPASAFGANHRRDRVFAVAYPHREHRSAERGPACGGQLRADLPRRGKEAVADTNREPSLWAPVPRRERTHWTTEPRLGRVAARVPSGVDRLRSLGNAVVPQVAEYVGRCIVAAERSRT